MPKRLCKTLRRLALACLLSGGLFATTSMLATSAAASEAETVSVNKIDDARGWADDACGWADDACGWTDASWEASNTCNFDPSIASTNAPSKADAKADPVGTAIWTPVFRRTASNFESTLAAAAAAACAKAGVSVEQLVEPFAMVGPQECNSLDEVIKLQEFWQVANRAKVEAELAKIGTDSQSAATVSSATDADTVASDVTFPDDAAFPIVGIVPIVDFDSILHFNDSWAPRLASASTVEETNAVETIESDLVDWDALDDELFAVRETAIASLDEVEQVQKESSASEDERNLHTFGDSVLADSSNDSEDANNKVATAPFVGSAPMIFTMEEVYMPYDFAARDLQVNNLFPLSKRPFCIRSRMELPELIEARSPSGEDELIVQDELDQVAATDAEPNLDNSKAVDRSLEDLVWHAENALTQYREFREVLRPNHIGQHVAAFVVSGNKLSGRVAKQVALVWPESAPQPPSPAGADLLARASAKPIAPASVEANQRLSKWLSNVGDVIEVAQDTWLKWSPSEKIADRDRPSLR